MYMVSPIGPTVFIVILILHSYMAYATSLIVVFPDYEAETGRAEVP